MYKVVRYSYINFVGSKDLASSEKGELFELRGWEVCKLCRRHDLVLDRAVHLDLSHVGVSALWMMTILAIGAKEVDVQTIIYTCWWFCITAIWTMKVLTSFSFRSFNGITIHPLGSCRSTTSISWQKEQQIHQNVPKIFWHSKPGDRWNWSQL